MADPENIELFDSCLEKYESVNYNHFSESYCLNDITEVKLKMIEFSNFLLGPGRLKLLYANKSDSEEFVFLILNMKKQLKLILSELGKFQNNKDYSFGCCVCNEKLVVPHLHFWEEIQNHEHVEELFYKVLSGGILPKQENNGSLDAEMDEVSIEHNSVVNSNYNDDNDTDNGIEQAEIDNDYNETDFLDEQCDQNNINSFRFNFVPLYDKVVQSKLYPEKTIQSLKRYDQTTFPTIILVGPSRAACLLCPCDLVSRSKIKMGRYFFLDHIAGNRHMKQATILENINGLINFHETWLIKDPNIQAHQVYFRPDIENTFWCILCALYVPSKEVESHIFADVHKSKISESYKKSSNSYYLLDLQLQVYGITIKPNIKENTPATPSSVKNKETKNKNVKNKSLTNNVDQSNVKKQSDDSPHKIIKSIENPSSESLLELIPNRFKQHCQYFFKNNTKIFCKICSIELSDNIPKLILHIYSSQHLDLSRIPLVQYNYYCEVCNLKLPDEFKWIKHFADVPKLHTKALESNKNKPLEFECTKCCTVIYGDELSLSRHLYTKGVRKPAEIKLAASVIKMFKSKESIEAEATKLISEANNTLECNGPTMECCQNVEKILKLIFDKCKVYPFGSRISGLGNQKSDLDLFLDIGDMYTGYHYQDSMAQIQIVKKVYAIMCKVKEQFDEVLQIPTARTPIVKFHHKKTRIDCDLSFRHGLSVENTKFLKFCFELQPITQPFILILKAWSHQNNLSEHITTYALAIMAIFYLQTTSHLLSVKNLRQLNRSNGLTIAGWETLGYTVPLEEIKKHIVPYKGSLVQLLEEFFLYYSKFPYSVDVICPLLGYCIKKKDFNDKGKNLPPEMNSYRARLKNKDPELFRNASAVCIQDPFDLSHNLTKALSPGILIKLRTLCDLSYKHIHAL